MCSLQYVLQGFACVYACIHYLSMLVFMPLSIGSDTGLQKFCHVLYQQSSSSPPVCSTKCDNFTTQMKVDVIIDSHRHIQYNQHNLAEEYWRKCRWIKQLHFNCRKCTKYFLIARSHLDYYYFFNLDKNWEFRVSSALEVNRYKNVAESFKVLVFASNIFLLILMLITFQM